MSPFPPPNAYREAVSPERAFVPLYRRIAQHYRDAILGCLLAPGMRIDSINRIQELHGVSRETAKRVLKTLVDEGLIVQKTGMGSFVIDRKPRRQMWAAVVPFYSFHYEYLLEQLAGHARRRGRQFRHFLSYNSWNEEIRLVGRLINERYEAVIVAPTLDESRTAEFYARLSSLGSFVTLIDHTMTGSFFPYVIQSYDLGVKRAMSYLQERTGGPIGFVRNEVWQERNLVQELMEETFRQIVERTHPGTKPLVVERVNRIGADFLRRTGARGFLCCDDGDAVRVIGRLRAEGVAVPAACAVVSYGNTELARYFTPAITSIDPHSEEMADTAAAILDMHLRNENTEYCQHVVQPELVVRDT